MGPNANSKTALKAKLSIFIGYHFRFEVPDFTNDSSGASARLLSLKTGP